MLIETNWPIYSIWSDAPDRIGRWAAMAHFFATRRDGSGLP